VGTSFNSVFYDPFKNKIYLKETINGQAFSDVIDHTFEYYVEDPTNTSPITDIYGKKVVKRTSYNKKSVTQIKESGIFTCETDLAQDIKFLHQRYEGRELKPDIKDFQICKWDIEIETGSEFPKPDEAKYPINLMTVHLSKQGKCYTFGNRPYEGKENYKFIEDEVQMLEAFIDFINRARIQILTGWNIVGFDIPYFINRCKKLGITKSISPIGKYWLNERSGEWTIPGIAILDYMLFYKDLKFGQPKYASYALQSISMAELGEGKLELEGFINDAYKINWEKYVDYNIQDVILVDKLDIKKKFIELSINLAHKSLIPIDKVFSATAIIEGQMLIDLHAENKVMNDKKEGAFKEDLPGAYVESVSGYYEKFLMKDFEGLYPQQIIHFNISPETLVLYPTDEQKKDLIRTPLSEEFGIWYKRKEGMIPKRLKKNIIERNEFKVLKKNYEKEGNKELQNYYDTQQAIRKIFNNSSYGVMGMEYYHYYDNNLAKSVTLGGQNIIKFIRDKMNLYFSEYFHKDPKFFNVVDEKNRLLVKERHIIIDTDSIYITLSDVKEKLDIDSSFLDWANKFDEDFLSPFFKKLLDKYFAQYGVENRINFKTEKIGSQIIVFGDKNYATMTLSNEGVVYKEPKFTVTGFSSVRSSTPAFCRTKIDEVLQNFFKNPDRKSMIEAIKNVKKEYKSKPIEDIAFPRGISNYRKYVTHQMDYYVKNGLTFESGTTIHARASMIYNYLITKYKLPNIPVDNGSKIKYFYTIPNNELKTNVVGFVGNCPNYIKENFKIDYEENFQVGFIQPMQKIFNVMHWGKVDINIEDISSYFE
jgi:Kyanoviridae DNA polymerase